MVVCIYEDYKCDVELLKVFFGKMVFIVIELFYIGKYFDLGVEMDWVVCVNCEKVCFFVCFIWFICKGEVGVKLNLCLGVCRNFEMFCECYVEYVEYYVVGWVVVKQVCGLMVFIYWMLQCFEDIIGWMLVNVILKCELDGSYWKIICNDQGKIGKIVDIVIIFEIDVILKDLKMDGVSMGLGMMFVYICSGYLYMYDGLCVMLCWYIKKVKVDGFGFYDLKGKGVIDMWFVGVFLEQI